jgi:hypothetical protein
MIYELARTGLIILASLFWMALVYVVIDLHDRGNRI